MTVDVYKTRQISSLFSFTVSVIESNIQISDLNIQSIIKKEAASDKRLSIAKTHKISY